MHKIALALTLIGGLLIALPAQALNVGDVAYICTKNQKFLWVMGRTTYSACPVRILRRAGGSYRVLAHRRMCLLPGFGAGSISRGREAWVEGFQLWNTRSSCENRGRKKPSYKKTYKPKPKKQTPPPTRANFKNHDLAGSLKRAKMKQTDKNNGLGKMMLTILEPIVKNQRENIHVTNKCARPIRLALRWQTKSGKWRTDGYWTLKPKKGTLLNSRGKAITTTNRTIYLHATDAKNSKKYIVSGPNMRSLHGKSIGMYKYTSPHNMFRLQFCP